MKLALDLSLPSRGLLQGAIGPSAPTMPAGALGVYYAKDAVTVPRRMIPNSVGTKLTDANMIYGSRRMFASFWDNAAAELAITEGVTAPDGSPEASSIVFAPTGTGWSLTSQNSQYTGTSNTVAGQTYTFAGSVKWLGTGTAPFRFGDSRSTVSGFTATTTWQRFSVTFVASTYCNVGIFEATAGQSANFAICDFELFPGSADLNPNPLGAKPPRIRNMDWIYADNAGSVVSGGAFQGGSYGQIQLDGARTLTNFTVLYLAKYARTPTNYATQGIICDHAPNGYNNFMIGKLFGSAAGKFNGNDLAAGAADSSTPASPPFGAGFNGVFVGAARYDGTAGSQYMNGVKVANSAFVSAGPTVTDLEVGRNADGFYSGYDIYALAIYPRALTDAEVVVASKTLAADASVTLTPRRTLYFQGTSITNGAYDTGGVFGAEGYANNLWINLAKPALGFNDGVPGSTLSANGAKVDAIKSAAIAAGAPTTHFVLYLEYGANNVNGAFLSDLAAYCDARRAAGWKVVVATILPRNDAGDGGTAFNALRNAHNSAIRGWVGLHCDAVSDMAANANIGPNAAANSTAYFNADKVHPNHAGHLVMGSIAQAAIDSI